MAFADFESAVFHGVAPIDVIRPSLPCKGGRAVEHRSIRRPRAFP